MSLASQYSAVDRAPEPNIDAHHFWLLAWKYARFTGGVLVTISRVVKAIAAMSNFDTEERVPAAFIMDLWMLAFGLVMLLVEDLRWCGGFRRGLTRRRLFHYARFLFVPPGSGYLYLLVASMLLSRKPSAAILDSALGMYIFGLASLSIILGHYTAHRLTLLKTAFPSSIAVREHFRGRDELTSAGLHALAEEVGVSLGPVSLEMTMGMLDADQNGIVSSREFIEWWQVDV